MTEEELDDRFGPALPPFEIRPVEAQAEPLTIHKLDNDLAAQFERMRQEVEDGGLLAPTVRTCTFLWLVDRSGDVLLSLELIEDPKGERMARPRGAWLVGGYALGHPMLVGLGSARIGGELYLQIGDDAYEWILDNKSGRYGRHPSRRAEHLTNVAERFASVGLPVYPDFKPTFQTSTKT